MDALIFSLNAVLPVFLTLLLGGFLRARGLFPQDVANGVNRLCYTLFIPLNIFVQLYCANMDATLDIRFVGLGAGIILTIFALLCLIVPRVLKDGVQRGEMIQGILRGNVSLLSISLMTNLYGEQGVAAMSYLLPVTLVLYNALSVVELSCFIRGGEKISIAALCKSVITNPFIIASMLGTVFVCGQFTLPTALVSTMESVSAVGAPMALLAMGAAMDITQVFRHARRGLTAALVRQLLIPLIVLSIAVALGFRGPQLGAYLCIFCTPTATVGYVLARNMGGEGKLSYRILIWSTLLSAVSMFVSIALLTALGML